MEPSYKVLRYWWSRIVWATSSANSYASSKYDSIAQRHQPQCKYRPLHWGYFVAISREGRHKALLQSHKYSRVATIYRSLMLLRQFANIESSSQL